jgi:hypothetical protein
MLFIAPGLEILKSNKNQSNKANDGSVGSPKVHMIKVICNKNPLLAPGGLLKINTVWVYPAKSTGTALQILYRNDELCRFTKPETGTVFCALTKK